MIGDHEYGCRPSRLPRISLAELRTVSPRSCASERMLPREPRTFLIMAGDRPSARSLSSKSRMAGTVSFDRSRLPDQRNDVQIQVALALVEGRALQPRGLAGGHPELARLLHGDAGAVGDMDALPHLYRSRGCELVSLFLQSERLEPALAGHVEIIDHPGGFRFALRCRPFPLADAHAASRGRICDTSTTLLASARS